MSDLVTQVRAALQAAAEPARVPAMEAYMKHRARFLGVQGPAVKRIVRDHWRLLRPEALADCEPVLRALWDGSWREERYAAFLLAERWRLWRWPEALALCEWMIRTGQWWDVVDGIATRLVGPLALRHAHTRPVVFGWIESEDLWLRRTALLVQLKWREETDTATLAHLIERTAREREFFIRKAIGWALRSYAYTDPDWVRTFVAAHADVLSPLSCREALKRL